jgi:hypothetical protein
MTTTQTTTEMTKKVASAEGNSDGPSCAKDTVEGVDKSAAEVNSDGPSCATDTVEGVEQSPAGVDDDAGGEDDVGEEKEGAVGALTKGAAVLAAEILATDDPFGGEDDEERTESDDERTADRTPGIVRVFKECLEKLNAKNTPAENTPDIRALMCKGTFKISFEKDGTTPQIRCLCPKKDMFVERGDNVCSLGHDYKTKGSSSTRLCRVWATVIAFGQCFLTPTDKGTAAVMIVPVKEREDAEAHQLWLVRDIWGHTHTHTHTRAHGNTQPHCC